MRVCLPLVVALGLTANPAPAEVGVRVASNLVDIDADAVPLADVLADLAGQTGMEIVYEGPPPRQLVSLTLRGRSPAEAVQDVLEGQGLNYALIADPTGRGVQTLMIAGAAGTGTISGSSSAPAPRPRVRRPILPPPAASPEALDSEYDEMYEEDPFEDPALLEEDPTGVLPPDPAPAAAPQAPAPAAGPMPFPGGQQIFPASPFTPQPTYPQPAPAEPSRGKSDGETP